jgi:hypothetical protein
MNLGDVFASVAHKKMAAVDIPEKSSNQHEINGVAALKEVFGINQTTRGAIRWHYFSDDRDPEHDVTDFTFYDARAKGNKRTGRSEWRFYYYGDFLKRVNEGDLLVLASRKDASLDAFLLQKDSGWERAVRQLFRVDETSSSFRAIDHDILKKDDLGFLQRRVLEEIGIEVELPIIETDESIILNAFGESFPGTKEMSAFAREHTNIGSDSPDDVLASWISREEQLFKALENVLVSKRLHAGFSGTEDFIKYSLSVQNRRKSRMGYALQNHLEEIFKRHSLRFTPQARTERNNTPDFIFPGQTEYHDLNFDRSLLVMLGVKSSSKDRWRQILTEADLIPQKHLFTLEPSISSSQTSEMMKQGLKLVIPQVLHPTYKPEQLKIIQSLADFISYVGHKQAA